MTHTLITPATDADWTALHDIREAVLFVARGRPRGSYDRNHPDDRAAANSPLLLKWDGQAVGTARLDDLGHGTGAVRLLAVLAAEQGRGHGRALSDGIEALARERGLATLYVNAARGASATTSAWAGSRMPGIRAN